MAAGFKVFQALLKVLPLIEEELVGGFVHGLLDVLEVKAQIVALAKTRLLVGNFFNFQRLLILPIAERARGLTLGDGDFRSEERRVGKEWRSRWWTGESQERCEKRLSRCKHRRV